MCPVDCLPGFDVPEFGKYRCMACGGEFKSSDSHPACPVCDSDDLELLQ